MCNYFQHLCKRCPVHLISRPIRERYGHVVGREPIGLKFHLFIYIYGFKSTNSTHNVFASQRDVIYMSSKINVTLHRRERSMMMSQHDVKTWCGACTRFTSRHCWKNFSRDELWVIYYKSSNLESICRQRDRWGSWTEPLKIRESSERSSPVLSCRTDGGATNNSCLRGKRKCNRNYQQSMNINILWQELTSSLPICRRFIAWTLTTGSPWPVGSH